MQSVIALGQALGVQFNSSHTFAILAVEDTIKAMRSLAADPAATREQLKAASEESWRWTVQWDVRDPPIKTPRPTEWVNWDKRESYHYELDQTRISRDITANFQLQRQIQERLGLLHALFELRRRMDPVAAAKEAEVEKRGWFYSRETTGAGLVPVHPDSPNWVIEFETGRFRRPVGEEVGFTIAELRIQTGGTHMRGRTFYRTINVPIPQGGGLHKWVPCGVRNGYEIECDIGPGVVRAW